MAGGGAGSSGRLARACVRPLPSSRIGISSVFVTFEQLRNTREQPPKAGAGCFRDFSPQSWSGLAAGTTQSVGPEAAHLTEDGNPESDRNQAV